MNWWRRWRRWVRQASADYWAERKATRDHERAERELIFPRDDDQTG